MTEFTNLNSVLLEGTINNVFNSLAFCLKVEAKTVLDDNFVIEVLHPRLTVELDNNMTVRVVGRLAMGKTLFFIYADHVEQLNR